MKVRPSSTRRASWWSPSRAASPATRSARTATTGPGPNLTDIGDQAAAAAIARTLENPTAPMPSFAGLPRERRSRRWSTSSAQLKATGQPRSCAPRPRRRAPCEEGQVRAMFDRIAGVYDLMNSVMTAGLHHRWRERAADLAAVGPGRPRARRRHRHRRPGDRAGAARRRRAARSWARTSPRRCSSARARRRRDADAGSGATRSSCPTPTTSFDAATVGFGARNFSDLERGLRRDGARRAPGRPRGRPRDHDADEAAACRRSSRSGSIASCRCSAACGRPRGLHLPAELGASASPAREALGGVMARGGPRATCAGSSPPAGSSRSTPGRWPDGAPPRRVAAVIEAGGAHVPRADGPRSRSGSAELAAVARRRCSPSTRRDDRGRRQAAAAAARVRWRPAAPRDEAGVLRAAVAVELIHSATLVHDDVLDGAALRRGRPTVFAAAGRALATATGDLLFSRAFAELAANGRAGRGPRALRRVLRAGRGRADAARGRLERSA